MKKETGAKSIGENIISSKNFEKNKGKISQFFNHLLAYGGFAFNDGIMRIWGDPSLFIPMNAFVYLFHELEERLGKDVTHEMFYWLGRLYGKNSTLMLINKFGIKKEDIPEFINGATQDGMGIVFLKQENKLSGGITQGIIEGENSIFAKEYQKEFGAQEGCVDYYLLGILAGGGEPLYETEIMGKEIECTAQGKDRCLYDLRSIEKHPPFSFLKGFKPDEKFLIDKTRFITLRRKAEFKMFNKKDIKFGDGTFQRKGIMGINMPIYGFVILDNFLKLLLKKDVEGFKISLAKKFVEGLNFKLPITNTRELLEQLEILGYGKFDIKVSGSKKAIISNSNNPYSSDYFEIFGRSKETIDSFICLLLKEAFFLSNKKVEVKETLCRAKGDRECLFEISFI